VADLIAEYIPVGVPLVNSDYTQPDANVQPDSSSNHVTSAVSEALFQPIPVAFHHPQPGSPALWNSWIQTVGQRFPMADMSVREVLDILDRRPEAPSDD